MATTNPTETTITIGIDVPDEDASGTLTVVTSTNPQTGTFTPTGGTAVQCTSVSWPPSPNAAVHFTFQLTTSNGDFPVPPNTPSATYNFTGNKTSASQANGHVNWPQDHLSLEGDQNTTWQGEATVEPQAYGQGAS